MKSFILSAIMAAGLLGIGSDVVEAKDIPCNSNYTTQRGDTLADIAKRAYGDKGAYQNIFTVNPQVLQDPNILPIGVVLYVPCTGVQSDGGLPPIRPSTGSDFTILTGKDYAPYVDAELPNGGFSTELVQRALQWDSQPANYRVDIVGDWNSHLQPLLSGGAYDLAYPWYKPDCRNRKNLGKASTWRCDNLVFSRPLHRIVLTTFGRSGAVDDISNPSDVSGKTICRPSGYYQGDIESMGLLKQNEIITPAAPRDCFEALMDGEADLVSVNVDTAYKIIDAMQIEEKVEEAVALSTVQTLHVVGMRTNPDTRLLMRRIDRGLKAIDDSGLINKIAPKFL